MPAIPSRKGPSIVVPPKGSTPVEPLPTERTKQCCLCNLYKPVNRFHKAHKRKDGYQTACRECLSKSQKAKRERYRHGEGTVTSTEKTCRLCKQVKLASEFYVSFQSRDHLTSRCKTCSQGHDPQKILPRLKKYGLTMEQYETMFTEQNHLCYICHQPETREYMGKVMPLSVDHDHVTNTPRKLLCATCNIAVGHIECMQRKGLLEACIEYLEEHS